MLEYSPLDTGWTLAETLDTILRTHEDIERRQRLRAADIILQQFGEHSLDTAQVEATLRAEVTKEAKHQH